MKKGKSRRISEQNIIKTAVVTLRMRDTLNSNCAELCFER